MNRGWIFRSLDCKTLIDFTSFCVAFTLFLLVALKSYIQWANSMGLGDGILHCVTATAPGNSPWAGVAHRAAQSYTALSSVQDFNAVPVDNQGAL